MDPADADRIEVGLHAGYVAGDEFLLQKLGGATVAWSPSEVVAVVLTGTVSPDFGESDYKGWWTRQIILENDLTTLPRDLSRMRFEATLGLRWSPISGEVEAGPTVVPFALYGLLGMGVVNTIDDLEAMQKTEDPAALATQVQLHPGLHVAGGLALGATEALAVRLEVADVSHVEVFESVLLEVKRRFRPLLAVAWSFPVR